MPLPRTHLRIRRIGGRLGAEVLGVDLAGRVDGPDFRQIRTALLRHQVIVVRGQHLDDHGHARFMSRFGPRIPEDGDFSDRWRTTGSDAVTPPQIISMWLGVIDAVPAEISFASTVGAYADLSDAVRAVADRLWAVHASSGEAVDHDGAEAGKNGQAPPRLGIAHPVVRVHPETGERSLLVGAFARWLLDHSPEQSRDVLHLLQAHVTAEENVLRWRLVPGDVVLIDNRVTQSFLPREREHAGSVRRIAVAGDAPLGVNGQHSYPIHRSEQGQGSWVAA